MFTGIIEEKGNIKTIQKTSEQSITMTIGAVKVLEDVTIGDSIAVNGICLTVTTFSSNDFQVDVMPETIKSTSLNDLITGSEVNLERAMRADSRFGGHFVSGHIDGVGEVMRKEKTANAVYYDIKVSTESLDLILEKGSIAVDGISFTIFNVRSNIVTISLIPHTVAETTLGQKSVGDIVNIEYDMLGKYVQHMLRARLSNQTNGINEELLKNTGFINE
ncbi:riboflavin synthase [Virgibacillus sp. W0181]|uniref:riboflavin synthase n=1 Tax=Virgibacillus sp. W0181 TaxID=3391581 RepID=UPI003F45D6D5